MKIFLAVLLTLALAAGSAGCVASVPKTDYDVILSEKEALASQNSQLASERANSSSQNNEKPKIGTIGQTTFMYPSAWTTKDIGGTIYYYHSAKAVMYANALDITGQSSRNLTAFTDAVLDGLTQSGQATISTKTDRSYNGTKVIETAAIISVVGIKMDAKVVCFIQGHSFIMMTFAQVGALSEEFSAEMTDLLNSLTEIS